MGGIILANLSPPPWHSGSSWVLHTSVHFLFLLTSCYFNVQGTRNYLRFILYKINITCAGHITWVLLKFSKIMSIKLRVMIISIVNYVLKVFFFLISKFLLKFFLLNLLKKKFIMNLDLSAIGFPFWNAR